MDQQLASPYKYLVEVGEGFWNIRGSFVAFGILELGTHMSVLRLSSGKFLVIDTIPLTNNIKTELDHLTDNGNLIDAVVATHPYHTLHFPAFYEMYPSVRFYGTPRHLNIQPTLRWSGSVYDTQVQQQWEPDVSMRIPDGAEFVNPPPDNHFSSVHVFHRASKALHVDDTISYYESPGCILRCLGVTPGLMKFHISLPKNGLLPTEQAPYDFKNWVQRMIDEWDFDTICTAHNGNKILGAKQMLQQTLDRTEPLFAKLSARNRETSVRGDDDFVSVTQTI